MFDLSAPISTWLPVTWYAGYMEGLPDLCVGRWPLPFGRTGSARYKVWYVETPDERAKLLAALDKPVPMIGKALDFSSGPDAATPEISALGMDFLAYYIPPSPGWPWLVVNAARGLPASMELGRGVYAYDAFDIESEAMQHLAMLALKMPDATYIVPSKDDRH